MNADSFDGKVVLILIDKGMLAIGGSIIAYVTAVMIERYKRDQAVVLELGKLRAQAFVNLAKLISDFEGALIVKLTLKERTDENAANFDEISDQIETSRIEVNKQSRKEFMVLDARQSKLLADYANEAKSLATAMHDATREKKPFSGPQFDECRARLKTLRERIRDSLPPMPRV